MSEFNHFGVMLDCSRNAVLSVNGVKNYILLLEKLGYNCLMLYTEDTYEVKDNPYFGYLRGRYSSQEIKELDAFGREHGVELIPCIQALAHMEAIKRWQPYEDIFDCNDILLAGDEKTYRLIDDMFASLADMFTSRLVNIGMDEAHMVGLGKYLDRHGYNNRFDILSAHLTRVNEIAKKYGFAPMMWSDMFFRLKTNGNYYVNDPDIFDESITSLVPENVGLIYWDYYSGSKVNYDNMIKAHQKFNNPVWFGGGLWRWTGFAPNNGFSIDLTKLAIQSCLENGVKDVFFTMWGDNGSETSFFAVLPSLYYTSKLAQGITDENEIKAGFEKDFGIAFDDFMLVDITETKNHGRFRITNPEKYMLYNDYFMGVYDSTVNCNNKLTYGEMAKKLAPVCESKEYGYIFSTLKALCEVLDLKYDIGVRTRKAYRGNDKKQLLKLVDDYRTIIKRLESFVDTFRKQWYTENKPNGFDIQELRIGGLILRTKSCADRLEAFANGLIESIPELDEDILDATGKYKDFAGEEIFVFGWNQASSVNIK